MRRHAVLSGLIALVVFGPIVGVVLDGYGFNLSNRTARGAAWIIAIVMAGRFLLSLYLQTRGGRAVLERFEGAGSGVHVLPPGYKTRLRWIVPLILVAAVIFPFFASKYLLTVVILGLIYVLLGLGLNIVVGLAGLLDLGYVAFYAIGAYGLALGYQYLGLGFWTVLPLAALMAAVAGALLGFPVLRMHGDYLAIVTLGFGEIIRLVLNNWLSFTGGPERHAGAGADLPRPGVRPPGQGWRRADPRVPRHRLQPQHEVPVHLRGAVPGGAAGALHQAPADADAGWPGLGSPARGRDRLSRDGPQPCAGEALGVHAGRLHRGDCRGVLRQLPGVRQPDLVHLLRVGADPRHRGAGRHGLDGGRGDRRLRAHRGAGAAAQLRRVPRAAVRHADGGDDDLAAARADPHQPRRASPLRKGVAP